MSFRMVTDKAEVARLLTLEEHEFHIGTVTFDHVGDIVGGVIKRHPRMPNFVFTLKMGEQRSPMTVNDVAEKFRSKRS